MITSGDNPRVKQARALLLRRGREQQGQCLVEGVRLVEDALRAGVRPALVFFAGEAMATTRGRELLELLADLGVPRWEVSAAVFDTLSNTVTSQGIVAVVPIPGPSEPAHPTLVLVLDQVRDPGNLGTILRCAAAAGAELVLLSQGCADPWSPKTLRAAMGAHFRLALLHNCSWDAVSRRLAGLSVWLADVRGQRVYDEVNWTEPSAVIVTSETAGASAGAIEASHGRVQIPMPGAAESLNVAMATAVLLFEAVRQRRRSSRALSVGPVS